MWILERVGGSEWIIGLLREGVNNWVSARTFERRNEWSSKSVVEWWNAWTSKWASGCVQLWEWMRERRSVWINEWRPKLIRELIYVNNLAGREVQREGESERVWCMGAENDHYFNVRSSLDIVLITQFDWLEVSLAWNCIEYVFADELSSAIIHHDLVWYSMISSENLIWTSICVYVVCVPFKRQYATCEYNHSSLSNVRMLLLIGL